MFDCLAKPKSVFGQEIKDKVKVWKQSNISRRSEAQAAPWKTKLAYISDCNNPNLLQEKKKSCKLFCKLGFKYSLEVSVTMFI